MIEIRLLSNSRNEVMKLINIVILKIVLEFLKEKQMATSQRPHRQFIVNTLYRQGNKSM